MAKSNIAIELLRQYPKAVIHLRKQVSNRRFGLVVGAGASRDFNVPLWGELIQKIAADPKVDGAHLLSGHASERSFPYKTEILFERFRAQEIIAADLRSLAQLEKENTVVARWMALCATHIYNGAPADFDEAIKKHSFLAAAIPLIQRSYLTVSFNFDDYLERALAARKRESDKGNRGFESVTDPWPQFRRTDSVIYHPHGLVPLRPMESPVDRFVFSEAGYSKQYFGARGHDSSFLISHFARNTCLLIGCSLEEELRNVLLRGAHINPGNYHYYVHYIGDGKKKPTGEERRLLFGTNFKVYNLITLFLHASEIRALLQLICDQTIQSAELKDFAKRAGVPLKYNYYMTGPLGVGKSTTASNLRSLLVLDEWLEARPDVLAKPWDVLTPVERDEADDWIAKQFAVKNKTLRHLDDADVGGIAIVDRPPLDPLVFTKPAERPQKAKRLLDAICPDRKWGVEAGVVIILTGDPKELSARVRSTGRDEYTSDKLERMQEDIVELYGGKPGVVVIDTRYLSVRDVTKLVAAVVHEDGYFPCNLEQHLKENEGAA